MKQTKNSCAAAGHATQPKQAKVSVQAIYAAALREVMADPARALAEHDPWLAALLTPRRRGAGEKS